jgi:hypothetical protein
MSLVKFLDDDFLELALISALKLGPEDAAAMLERGRNERRKFLTDAVFTPLEKEFYQKVVLEPQTQNVGRVRVG